MSNIKDKLIALVEFLEKSYDFEDEFYQTYSDQLNEGDISDWHNNHFEDNVELGYGAGVTSMAEEMVATLKKIIEEESV